LEVFVYIIFATHRRISRVSAFLTSLREHGIHYDVQYGVRRLDDGRSVVRAPMTGADMDSVELMSGVLAVTMEDPTNAPDDPLSGCDEEYEDPHGPLEGCDEEGDPDD
jgi:hypothetical protein